MIRLPFGSTPANQFHSRKTFFFFLESLSFGQSKYDQSDTCFVTYILRYTFRSEFKQLSPTHSPQPTYTPQRQYLLTCMYSPVKRFLLCRGKYFKSIHHSSNKLNRQEVNDIDLLSYLYGINIHYLLQSLLLLFLSV